MFWEHDLPVKQIKSQQVLHSCDNWKIPTCYNNLRKSDLTSVYAYRYTYKKGITMLTILKKIIAITLTICFLGTNVLYAEEAATFKLSPPTRFSRMRGPEFKQTTQIIVGIKECLKDLTEFNPKGLRAIGKRELLEYSVFGEQFKGELLFNDAVEGVFDERVLLEGKHYIIRANVRKAGTFYCLISMSGDTTYDVSVIPGRVMDLALEKGLVKFSHTSLDEKDKSILDKYLEHELSTEDNIAIDEWIRDKMENNQFAVDAKWGKDANYLGRGERFSGDQHKLMLKNIEKFLTVLGVENIDSIIEAQKEVPLVFIPYDESEKMPAVKIDGQSVPVYGHSSEFATYIFIKREVFEHIMAAADWRTDIMPGIQKILLHEVGARCGKDVMLDGDEITNILDKYYRLYEPDEEDNSAIASAIEADQTAEELKELKPVDNLSDLEYRNDYAYGETRDKSDAELARESAHTMLEADQDMLVEQETFRDDVEREARDIFSRAKDLQTWWIFRVLGLRALSDRLIRFAARYRDTQKNIFYFTISLGGIQLKARAEEGAKEHNPKEYRRVIDNMTDYLTGSENRFLVRSSVSIIAGLAKGTFMTRFVAGSVLWVVKNIMARRFFIGEEIDQAMRTIEKLEGKGISLTVDNVGEMSLCAKDTDNYVKGYLKLTESGVPAISIKLSNLTHHWNPNAWERTKAPVKEEMKRIIEAARAISAEVTIDMEEYKYKDLTIEIFLELLEETRYLNLSLAMQSYLRDETREDLKRIVNRVRKRDLPKPLIRLVKGANIVPDGIAADAEGHRPPQYAYKEETDINFDRCAEYILENSAFLRPAFATHNVRSMAVIIRLAEKMGISGDEFEFQYLHGMIQTERVRAIQEKIVGGEKIGVRFYGPFGPFVRGLGYFVRRLVEKTDPDAFLKKEGYGPQVVDEAVRDPREILMEKLNGIIEETPVPRAERRNPILSKVDTGLETAKDLADYYMDQDQIGIAEIFLKYRREVIDLAHWTSRGLMDKQGRTNELIIEPRGLVLLICEDPYASDEEIAERLAAPIAAGNKVIAYLNNEEQFKRFEKDLMGAGISDDQVDLYYYDGEHISQHINRGFVDSISYMGPKGAGGERLASAYYKQHAEDLNRFLPENERYVSGTTSDRNFVSKVDPDHVKQFLRTRVFSEFTNRAGFDPRTDEEGPSKGLPGFRNVEQLALHRFENQKVLEREVDNIESRYNKDDIIPLVINGDHYSKPLCKIEVKSAADPDYRMGWMSLAQPNDVNLAVDAAKEAQTAWEAFGAVKRAEILLKFAELAEDKRLELAALMMWESGKNAEEALADVDEGIDFARFYALDAVRSEKEEAESLKTKSRGRWEGWHTEANGVSAVISPWNFPFAIPTGQILSSLAAGNSVVFKPSGQSPLIGYEIIKLLEAAGIPQGVMNFVPGKGKRAGEALVLHPDVDEILFTGSAEAGLRIKELAAGVDRGDRAPKHVIAEMGGNNAIIVDEGTDVEQAIKIILASAFGYSAQKCSACNRVIVMEGSYEQFWPRLQEAALALIDVMDDPRKLGAFFGPLIDDNARERMEDFISRADESGLKVLAEAQSDKTQIGFKIYMDVDPGSPLAQEEQFFPTLSLIKAETFEEAVDILNDTAYGLTGGLISQIPEHIEYARENVEVGNFTVNGKITGALVGQQSFGGSGLSGFSGFGSKAGGMGHVWYHRHWVKMSIEEALSGSQKDMDKLIYFAESLEENSTRIIDQDGSIYSVRRYSVDFNETRLLVRVHAEQMEGEIKKDRIYVINMEDGSLAKINGQDYYEVDSSEDIVDIQNSLFEFASKNSTISASAWKEKKQTYEQPLDVEIQEIATRILETDIELFIPKSQFPGDTLKKFKEGLGRVFEDKIRPYDNLTDLVRMIKHPEKAMVMTVDLTVMQIEDFRREVTSEDGLMDVRFMNFEGRNINELIENGVYENYLKDIFSKLLVARTITKETALNRDSFHYRMLAHLLEGHLPVEAIDAYIRQIADNTIGPFDRLYGLLNSILKSIPIQAYDERYIKPAVEILWAA